VVSHWAGGFRAKFIIVNDGSNSIDGWQLSVTFPEDDIKAVWQANYHTSSGTLIMSPPASQKVIAPGGSLTENISAEGSTTNPTSCTFNGSPC
jgi:cellulase/cellobiase CelA1